MRKKNKSIKVGITGGIGAGKSLVCKIFSALGIPVYSADERAKWITNHDKGIVKKIKDYFGEEAYFPGGELNRAFLAKNVFNKEDQLNWLNKQVHPKVKEDYDVWESKQNSPYTIKEAALLFESGSYKQLDFVITINAPQPIRVKRVLHRDINRSENQVNSIIAKQLTDEERSQLANYVIQNDNSMLIVPEVLKIHNQFLKKSIN